MCKSVMGDWDHCGWVACTCLAGAPILAASALLIICAPKRGAIENLAAHKGAFSVGCLVVAANIGLQFLAMLASRVRAVSTHKVFPVTSTSEAFNASKVAVKHRKEPENNVTMH